MTNLSFIIPAYNASSTIVRCLDSIYTLALNENDFEVIVVDDCSTDNTVTVIEEYAKLHNNLILLRQKENHRQGAARNRGLEIAKGEFITFVDSDDIILAGVADALKIAIESAVDLVYCSCYHEQSPSELILKEIKMHEAQILTGVNFCEQYQNEGVFWYPWGILYNRQWLTNLHHQFIEDRQHEDRDWLAYVMSSAGSVANSKSPIYRYVCNPNSTCRLPRYSTVFDHIASGIRHIDLSKQLAEKCPNLSATLYAFGVDEIHKSIRLRNLTKYAFKDNKNFYSDKCIKPLLPDLKRICRDYKMPKEVVFAVHCPRLMQLLAICVSPIVRFIRTLKH